MPYVLIMLLWSGGPDAQDYTETPMHRYDSEDTCNANMAVVQAAFGDNPNVEFFCVDAKYYPNVK